MRRLTGQHAVLIAVAGASGLLSLTVCGCAAARPSVRPVPAGNVLFGPEWIGIPTFDVPRSDWPATVAGPPADEYLEFRTSLYDHFGRQGRGDYLHRTFHSIRVGTSRGPAY